MLPAGADSHFFPVRPRYLAAEFQTPPFSKHALRKQSIHTSIIIHSPTGMAMCSCMRKTRLLVLTFCDAQSQGALAWITNWGRAMHVRHFIWSVGSTHNSRRQYAPQRTKSTIKKFRFCVEHKYANAFIIPQTGFKRRPTLYANFSILGTAVCHRPYETHKIIS